MKGYKIFNPDFTCRGYKFEENNKCEGPLEICVRGFHFCPKAVDCLQYYEYTPTNTYAEVESQGPFEIKNDKVACLELKIIRKLTYEEFGELLTGTLKTPYSEFSFLKGKKEGICKSWYTNGQLSSECNYNKGKLDGIYKYWDEFGQLLEEYNFLNGEKNGVCKSWYKHGQLGEEWNYTNGKRNGICKSWDEFGQLLEECNFVNDVGEY